MNQEVTDIQTGFRKGKGTRNQIANIQWIREKASKFQKTPTSVLLTTLKPLTEWITTTWKILKQMGIQTTSSASWEICMHIKQQQLELDME